MATGGRSPRSTVAQGAVGPRADEGWGCFRTPEAAWGIAAFLKNRSRRSTGHSRRDFDPSLDWANQRRPRTGPPARMLGTGSDRLQNDVKLAKFAGLAWRRCPPCKLEAKDRPLARSRSRHLRYCLVEAANPVRARGPPCGPQRQKCEKDSDRRHWRQRPPFGRRRGPPASRRCGMGRNAARGLSDFVHGDEIGVLADHPARHTRGGIHRTCTLWKTGAHSWGTGMLGIRRPALRRSPERRLRAVRICVLREAPQIGPAAPRHRCGLSG